MFNALEVLTPVRYRIDVLLTYLLIMAKRLEWSTLLGTYVGLVSGQSTHIALKWIMPPSSSFISEFCSYKQRPYYWYIRVYSPMNYAIRLTTVSFFGICSSGKWHNIFWAGNKNTADFAYVGSAMLYEAVKDESEENVSRLTGSSTL